MPLQILNELGQGEQLGQMLRTGLQGLAQSKLQQMQQQKTASSLGSLLGGLSADQARSLSMLPPELQQQFIKSELQRPSEEAYAQALGLGGLGGQQAGIPALSGLGQPQADTSLTQIGSEKLPRLNQRQATELAKLQEKRAGRLEKKEADLFKETKADRKEILESSQAAKQDLQDLKRLEELDKTGKLTSPAYNEFLTRSGLDIPALRSPESQEFLKIRQSFLRDAKKYFGSRVSNFELEQFLKTIPDLSQTPEGRKRVIANLKRFNRLPIERKKAMNEVLDKNDGIPPRDFLEQIDKKMKRRLDGIAEKFKMDIAREVPQSSGPIATTLGAIGGEIAGRLPAAAGGALYGATKGGIPGALIGGLGGLAAPSLLKSLFGGLFR